MPFRVFAAGEVLTAANVNDYLAEQAISTFAGTAARASAITAPTEGQFAYLSDSDSLTFYNGSAWVNAGSAIAGTALSSGTATSGQVLTANGSGGVSFSTGTQGLTLIKTQSFSAVSSTSVEDVFSSTYKKYLMTYSIDGSTTAQTLAFRLRVSGADNTTSNYSDGNWGNNSETAGIVFNQGTAGTQFSLGAVKSGSDPNSGQFFILNPFASAKTQANGSYAFIDTYFRGRNAVWTFNATTSFTGFSIYCASGTITGVISVYGINE